jgi:hypothetical protein
VDHGVLDLTMCSSDYSESSNQGCMSPYDDDDSDDDVSSYYGKHTLSKPVHLYGSAGHRGRLDAKAASFKPVPMSPECPNRDSACSSENTHWVVTDGPRAAEIFTVYTECQTAMEKTSIARGGSFRGFRDYSSAKIQSDKAVKARVTAKWSIDPHTNARLSEIDNHMTELSHITKPRASDEMPDRGVRMSATSPNRPNERKLVNPFPPKALEPTNTQVSPQPTRTARARTPVMSPASQADVYAALDESISPIDRDNLVVMESRYRGINDSRRVTRIGRGIVPDIPIGPGREITTFVGTRITREHAGSHRPEVVIYSI